MKIFISWSKENSTSHKVATALHEWLPDVIQGVDPWMSTHDIQSGELWGSAVSKQLEANSYGILSITPMSMDAPWLIFEAGALAKFVEKSRVCPYLSNMNPTGLTGPLTQLQSRISDEEGTLKLVQDINKHLNTPMSEDRLQRSFTRCWPELKDKLSSAYASDDIENPKPIKRDDRELLEEMLTLIREMSRSSSPSRTISQKVTLDTTKKDFFNLASRLGEGDLENLLRDELDALINNGASISSLEDLHKRARKFGNERLISDIRVAISKTKDRNLKFISELQERLEE